MTVKLKQLSREGAPLSDQCELERVERIIHEPITEPAFLFVESIGVAGADASSPTNYSKEKYRKGHRLIKDLQHSVAHVKGSQLPQEVKSAHSLLVDSFSVRSPVQSVVDSNTKVLLILHRLHILSQNVQ